MFFAVKQIMHTLGFYLFVESCTFNSLVFTDNFPLCLSEFEFEYYKYLK